jgi:hypothetical protein
MVPPSPESRRCSVLEIRVKYPMRQLREPVLSDIGLCRLAGIQEE